MGNGILYYGDPDLPPQDEADDDKCLQEYLKFCRQECLKKFNKEPSQSKLWTKEKWGRKVDEFLRELGLPHRRVIWNMNRNRREGSKGTTNNSQAVSLSSKWDAFRSSVKSGLDRFSSTVVGKVMSTPNNHATTGRPGSMPMPMRKFPPAVKPMPKALVPIW